MSSVGTTPLPQKLGIKPGVRLAIVGAPAGFARTLGELPDRVEHTGLSGAPVDVLIAFHTDASALRTSFADHARSVAADGALWVAWPKRASGMATDLDENLLREVGLPTGMVDNKVCAIDEVWSGLRFVVRKENRAAWAAGHSAAPTKGDGPGPAPARPAA